MKFSFRQILASAAGAVIAALIASSFGVTGTIIGVAIGSMAATMGTALVSQSIERGQKAVKQVVVRVPEGRPTSSLLRRVGGTDAAGAATSSVGEGSQELEATEVVGAVGQKTTEMAQAPVPLDVGATGRLQVRRVEDGTVVSAGAPGPATVPASEDFEARTAPLLPTTVLEGAGVVGVTGGAGVATAAESASETPGRRFTWKAFVATAAIVFLLAFGIVTAIELAANRATVFTPSSPGTPTTTIPSTPSTTTTSTNGTTSSTTTSTTAASTTTTTAPSTTTTAPRSATTTTTTSATTAGP